LSSLVFASPFRAAADQSHRLAIRVAPTGQGATITMRAGGDPEAEPIVTGEARPYRGAPPAMLNLATIKARCQVRQVAPADGRLEQNFMTFGPRWANLRRVDFGQSEALVELALSESFSNDLSGF